jgi:hypothetical protein
LNQKDQLLQRHKVSILFFYDNCYYSLFDNWKFLIIFVVLD